MIERLKSGEERAPGAGRGVVVAAFPRCGQRRRGDAFRRWERGRRRLRGGLGPRGLRARGVRARRSNDHAPRPPRSRPGCHRRALHGAGLAAPKNCEEKGPASRNPCHDRPAQKMRGAARSGFKVGSSDLSFKPDIGTPPVRRLAESPSVSAMLSLFSWISPAGSVDPKPLNQPSGRAHAIRSVHPTRLLALMIARTISSGINGSTVPSGSANAERLRAMVR